MADGAVMADTGPVCTFVVYFKHIQLLYTPTHDTDYTSTGIHDKIQ